MRLKLLACEILFREVCAVAARAAHSIDIDFLPKGLHDMGQHAMRDRLRQAIDAVDASRYDAILLGYGLCSNGITELQAVRIPIVVPRAHDCITLFLGDKERYLEYFTANPGTYFKTTGWLERGDDLLQFNADSLQNRMGISASYDDLVAKYGVDNAKYLWRQLSQMRHYGKLAFIETGVEPDARFEQQTRDQATERGWKFEKIQGDLRLLQWLVDGLWDPEHFLVVRPGQRIAASFDDHIVTTQDAIALDNAC